MIETLIVDGYNIIHAIPQLETELDGALKNARSALEKMLRNYQATEKSIRRIYVIYDSKNRGGGETEDLGLVKNIYASSEGNADGEIVNMLKNASRPGRIAVLSRDNFVINHTRAIGANVLSVENFHRKIAKHKGHSKAISMSNEEKEKINKELKKVWGIK